ncbi:MAG: nucleotidyltransferase domain-containing protein [Caldilineaceae bacterium]|nr:nucleotidyltransferase domain-containing protein [Caldilineaceae bacterium]MDE0338471.1 nucleotidyltransferase domain-containing protein [Caldilineaceae bacterium]
MSGNGGANQGDAMMAHMSDAVLDQMVEKIVEEVNPDQIILFGSRARGDARAGSDVDLVVVESEPFGQERSRRQEAARLYRTLSGFLVSKDILVYSRDEVHYWRDSLNHVLARALREGRVLYERR